MKLSILFLLFISLNLQAQNAMPDSLPEKLFKLTVNKVAPSSVRFPFRSIKIIDSRFDTSKLGYQPVVSIVHNKKRVAKKIIMEGGVATAMENYYNNYYRNAFTDNDFSLLVVLKKLWLSGTEDDINNDKDIVEKMYGAKFLYCKLEYYLCKGSLYYPFKRLDTVVNGVSFEAKVSQQGYFSKNTFNLILAGLVETVDYNKAIDKLKLLPSKTLEDIIRYNAGYFKIPVLKDTAIAKGVFISFEEFRMNKPAVIRFKEKEIKSNGRTLQKYLEDENGNRIINYWGYNTGDYLKVSKYNNQRIYRINNTFEFFVTAWHSEVASIINGPGYRLNEFWVPYQLDMETGEIY